MSDHRQEAKSEPQPFEVFRNVLFIPIGKGKSQEATSVTKCKCQNPSSTEIGGVGTGSVLRTAARTNELNSITVKRVDDRKTNAHDS